MKILTFEEYSSIYTDRKSEAEYELYKEVITKIIGRLPFQKATELSSKELSEKIKVSEYIKYSHELAMDYPSLLLSIFSFQSKNDPNMAEILRFEEFFISKLKITKDTTMKLSKVLSYIDGHNNLPIKMEVLNKMKNDFTQYFTLEQSLKSLSDKIGMKDSIYQDGIHQALIDQIQNKKS